MEKHSRTYDLQSARMSKIENGGLDQYGAEPFEQQQFIAAGVEGVKESAAAISLFCVFDSFFVRNQASA